MVMADRPKQALHAIFGAERNTGRLRGVWAWSEGVCDACYGRMLRG